MFSQQQSPPHPGEKFQALHFGVAQQAWKHSSDVAAVGEPSRFMHCKPARFVGKGAQGGAFDAACTAANSTCKYGIT